MSGTGQTAIPQRLVDSDRELVQVWYEFGRDAARAGFRAENRMPLQGEVLQNSFCATTEGEEFIMRCGPFRIDHFVAPLWYPIRDFDYTKLPPR